MGKRRIAAVFALGYTPVVFDERDDRREIQSIAALVAEDPVAVFICTPGKTHTDVLVRLCDAGYAGPLFVEKPISFDGDPDVDRWRAWPHTVVAVGYNWRFHEDLVGVLLKPYEWLAFECWTDIRKWNGSDYGDPLLECSHEIDAALALGATFEWGEISPDGTSLRFRDPLVVIDLWWHSEETRRKVYRGIGKGAWYRDLDLGATLERSYAVETEAFLDCVKMGKLYPRLCNVEAALKVLETSRAVAETVQAPR